MSHLDKIIDQAHAALRGIDAADQTVPIPERQLDAVADAVREIELFARDFGIALSEFKR